MKFRSFVFSVVAAGSMGFAMASYADTIAYVNTQQIFGESTAAKSAKEQLDSKQKLFQGEVRKKEGALRTEEQELSKQKSVLAPEAFGKKAKDFGLKVNAAQKEAQMKKAELDDATASSVGEIQKAVFDIVSKIAKEKGYSAVLPTTSLLYADPKLDITKEVLDKLNSTLPKVTVKFKTPAAAKDDE